MAPLDSGAILNLVPGVNKNFRLRMGFDGAIGSGGDLTDIVFYVSHNGGSPFQITNASSYLQGCVSANITQSQATTNQLPVPGGDTFLSQPGCISIATAQSNGLLFETGQAIEAEIALTAIASQLSSGDTLDFTWAGFVLGGTYAQIAGNVRLTIQIGAPLALLSATRIPNIGFR